MAKKPAVKKMYGSEMKKKGESLHCFELAPRHRFLELLQNNIAERLAGRMEEKRGG